MANDRDITFATINLLNLQLWDGHTYDEDRTAFKDEAEYKRRIAWLADHVLRLKADVIGFQELWAARALEDVFETAALSQEFDLVARDAPGIGKPQVALAARKGWLVHADWIEEFPRTFRFSGFREKHGAQEPISVSIDKFSRPLIAATIEPPGSRPKPPAITVYVAHLKSKAPAQLVPTTEERPPALRHHAAITQKAVAHVRRIMEAGALRAILDAQMASSAERELSPTVVLGDLNDDTHAISTALLSGEPSYKLFASSRAGERSDKGLYSCETLQQYRSQRHVYYTYNHKNALSTLDHIMVSEEFYDHSRKRQWSFVEMEVLNDHLAYADESRTAKQALLSETGALDHGIVRAEFAWNPIKDDIRRLARNFERNG